MFEAIKFEGVSTQSGTTVVSYEPCGDDSLDISVMFKPQDGCLYGPHVAVFGYADYNGHMTDFRERQGLHTDGRTLYTSRTRTFDY